MQNIKSRKIFTLSGCVKEFLSTVTFYAVKILNNFTTNENINYSILVYKKLLLDASNLFICRAKRR